MTTPMIDVVDDAGVEVVAIDQRAQRVRREIDRMPARELAVPAPERRPHCIDDDGVSHVGLLRRATTIRSVGLGATGNLSDHAEHGPFAR